MRKVPSYEEWQANQKWIKHLEEKIKIYERKDKQATETSLAYNELLEKNEKLQEQLDEANKLIKWVIRVSWTGNQEEDDFDRYIYKWNVK